MKPHHSAVTDPKAILDSALEFGLNEREVLRTVTHALYCLDEDATVSELLEELTDALARGIVSKERRVIAANNP
jgi:hypothetical protein